jgi:hypothetical protein
MKTWFLVGLLTVAGIAGCLGKGGGNHSGPSTTYPSIERPVVPFDTMPEGAGHDHSDSSQHKFLWHYDFSARDGLLENPADIAGLHAIDLQAGYLFGAVYGSHSLSVDGGVQIWDAKTDPAHPKELGRWTIPGSVGGDRSIGATPDGDFVVIGLEPVDCLGHVNPEGAALSAYLIDARNKMVPLVADVITATGGSLGGPTTQNTHISTHSVYVHRIQGVDYAFIFGDIYRIDRSEQGGRLVFVGSISTGHDIYVRDTPWNTTWALSANGGGGLVVFDVTDPAHAFEVGTWDLPDRKELAQKQGDYYFHTADVDFVGDQAVVVLSSEDFAPHVSPFWVLDGNPMRDVAKGSEPVTLSEMGEWHNPYNHTAANIRFSLHNPRFTDHGVLTISSYHAGFFQLDLRNPDFWAHPAEIAAVAYADGTPSVVIDPVESTVENRLCGLGISIDTPEYMDVAVQNGTVYLADVFMGLYTFTPTADHPIYGTAARIAALEHPLPS